MYDLKLLQFIKYGKNINWQTSNFDFIDLIPQFSRKRMLEFLITGELVY